MKLKIKVKYFGDNKIRVNTFGDWIDLRAAETVNLTAPKADTLKRKTVNGETTSSRDVKFAYSRIPLGVAMELPKGFEALVVARSSTLSCFGVITSNSVGVIDNSYCGDSDEWKYPALAIRNTVINKGERICQFRIQLSQKATVWQKLKWLFSNGIEIVEVSSLNESNRGGFGSTGIK